MELIEQEVKDIFDSICWKLNRGDVSNYQASIGLFSSVGESNEMTEQSIIKNIFGPSTESDFFQECELKELVLGITECIDWKGDEAVFPNRKYHATAGYAQDMAVALSKLRNLFQTASGICSFVIEKGHPFYPVFWEFAYLVRVPKKNYVLVGSCSD